MVAVADDAASETLIHHLGGRETDIAVARDAVGLIAARGFHRDHDVVADLEQVIAASQEA